MHRAPRVQGKAKPALTLRLSPKFDNFVVGRSIFSSTCCLTTWNLQVCNLSLFRWNFLLIACEAPVRHAPPAATEPGHRLPCQRCVRRLSRPAELDKG